MNRYTIKIYKNKETKIEKFVKQNGTVFNSFDFLNSVGENYKCVAVSINYIVLGILPYVYSSKYKKMSINLPPFTYVSGPVFGENNQFNLSVFELLIKNVLNEARIDFRLFNMEIISALQTKGFKINQRDVQIIKNNGDDHKIKLSKDKRKIINKFERFVVENQVRIIEGKDSLKYVLELYKKTSELKKFKSNFKEIERIAYSGISYYSNVIIDSNGVVLSGVFCPLDNHKMYLLTGTNNRDVEKKYSKSNAYSIYLAIQKSKELNIDFDFMGSMIQGVAKFNISMGAVSKKISSCTKTNSSYYKAIDFIKNKTN